MTLLIIRLASRFNLWVLPATFVLFMTVLSFVAASISSGDLVRAELPNAHFVGTTALFVLLPAYLMVITVILRQRTEELFGFGIFEAEAVSTIQLKADSLPTIAWVITVFGFMFGLMQNEAFVRSMWNTGEFTFIDVVFVLQSAILWAMIAELILWRVRVSYAISEATAILDVDVYDLSHLKPIVKLATLDILIVAGAMAFMPLQSLDAEFRIFNYTTGFVVGTLSALALFALPMIGIRRCAYRSKARLTESLSDQIAEIDHNDVASLEVHLSHLDRVRSLPLVPLDVNLISRVVGYIFIPPLAWTGAALLERLIDGM